ncbi:hypothetical protein EV363DRAFT_1337152 [Boletus edulis]|nr:hypothetical protein EV363DRAFT_1337152 [Boletus edulis]
MPRSLDITNGRIQTFFLLPRFLFSVDVTWHSQHRTINFIYLCTSHIDIHLLILPLHSRHYFCFFPLFLRLYPLTIAPCTFNHCFVVVVITCVTFHPTRIMFMYCQHA